MATASIASEDGIELDAGVESGHAAAECRNSVDSVRSLRSYIDTDSAACSPKTQRRTMLNRPRALSVDPTYGRWTLLAHHRRRRPPSEIDVAHSALSPTSSAVPLSPLLSAFDAGTSTAPRAERRKNTEALVTNFRNSFLAWRRPVAEGDLARFRDETRPSSRIGRYTYRKAEDLLLKTDLTAHDKHQRRKDSISDPFNFQHITHTPRQHLVQLQDVPQQNLAARFWALSALEKMPIQPRVRMRADELREKIHREMGIPKLPPPSHLGLLMSSSALPRPSLPPNSMMMRRPQTAWSSLGRDPTSPHSADANASPIDFGGSFGTSDPDAVVMSASALPPRRQSLSAPKLMSSKPITSPTLASNFVCELPGDSPTLQQSLSKPLPPLVTQFPPAVPSKTRSDSLHEPKSRMRSFTVNKLNPKRISRSLPRSTKLARLSEEIFPSDILDDSNWEADVDFCYQHSAESTCDFDWSFVDLSISRPMTRGSTCDSMDSANVPGQTLSSRNSNLSISVCGNVSEARTPSPISERFVGDHHRGPSVGHRGFLAARNAGTTPTTPVLDLSVLDQSSDYGCDSPALGRGAMNFPRIVPQSNGPKWSPRVDSAIADYPSDEECILTGINKPSLGLFPASLSCAIADDSAVHSTSKLRQASPVELPMRQRSKSAASGSVRPFVAPQWPPVQSSFTPKVMVSEPQTEGALARQQLPRRPSTPQRFSRLLDSPM